MDEIKIGSGFIGKFVGRIIRKMMLKKFGCETQIEVGELKVFTDNGKARVRICLNAEMSQSELSKLLDKIAG